MKYVRFFADIGIEDVPLVGGKNASLGEMYRNLASQGVAVPTGFAITADAYRNVLERAGALAALHAALDGLRADDLLAHISGKLAALARLTGRQARREEAWVV